MATTYHDALPIGYELHWYVIEAVLGQGGFGITYLARDTNLDRLFALKEYMPAAFATRSTGQRVVPLSDELEDSFAWGLQSFIGEARTLEKFEHPNIVRVHSVFEKNDTAYMVMRYEEGKNLEDVFSHRRNIAQSELDDILFPILEGLERVHEAGYIHRDIKPDNIYLRSDGSPVLLDFGSARQALGSARTLTAVHTPGYAPIEQYHASALHQGPWTDIYGLGATVYRAVAGVAPVDALTRVKGVLGNTRDILVPAVDAGRERFSERFLAAIDHALQLQETSRPQTIAEWRRDFEDGPIYTARALPGEGPDASARESARVEDADRAEPDAATGRRSVAVRRVRRVLRSLTWRTMVPSAIGAAVAVLVMLIAFLALPHLRPILAPDPLEPLVTELGDRLKEREAELEAARAELKGARDRVALQDRQLEQLNESGSGYQSALTEAQANITRLNARFEDESQALLRARASAETAQADLEVSASELDQARQRVAMQGQELDRLTESESAGEAKLAAAHADIARLTVEVEEKSRELDRAKHRLVKLGIELERRNTQLDEARQRTRPPGEEPGPVAAAPPPGPLTRSASQLQIALRAYGAGDYGLAMDTARPLAENGLARAQYLLGVMYLEGLGISPSGQEASQWLSKGARQRNPAAQAKLGTMYAEGRGVSNDDLKAYMWLNAAVENGERDMSDALEGVGERLERWEIEQARHLSKQFIGPPSEPSG